MISLLPIPCLSNPFNLCHVHSSNHWVEECTVSYLYHIPLWKRYMGLLKPAELVATCSSLASMNPNSCSRYSGNPSGLSSSMSSFAKGAADMSCNTKKFIWHFLPHCPVWHVLPSPLAAWWSGQVTSQLWSCPSITPCHVNSARYATMPEKSSTMCWCQAHCSMHLTKTISYSARHHRWVSLERVQLAGTSDCS